MSAYRKKPVVIEAEQFNSANPNPAGVCWCGSVPIGEGRTGRPHIHTLEGVHNVSDGDWIITGVQGERYPCKPDIFALTYEPVSPIEEHTPNG